MSRDGSCEVLFGGDSRRFKLGLEQIFALQDKRGGLWEITERFRRSAIWLEDVQEILRLGLMGAGVDQKEARRIIETHVTPGRLHYSGLAALAVLNAALSGAAGEEDSPPGKETALAQEAAPAAASAQPHVTSSAPPSDSIPMPSGE